MKNTFLVKFLVILIFISVVLFACSNRIHDKQPLLPQSSEDTSVSSIEPTESPSIAVKNQDEPFKIFIASDTHVFFSNMRDDSDAFKNFEANGEGKMLTYSDHIMGAFVHDVLTERPDAVILSGDLTLNGEKLGHEGLAAWMSKITEVGIQVLVIPGNHDINNPFAREIKDGQFYKAEYVSPMEFEEIYAPYGYANPAYRDTNSLSYISILNDNLYAVMLDTCTYETNIKQNISVTSGAVRPETLEWIESSVKAIKQQKPQAHFITVLHHNLLMHHRFFNNNFVLKNTEEVSKKFAELGLSVFFSGHIHVQHILSKTVNSNEIMTEVVNSSQIVYPSAYGVAQFDKNGMQYYVQNINMRRYAEAQGLTDTNLLNFEDYSKSVFNRRGGFGSKRLAALGYSEDDVRVATEVIGLLNTYFFAGRIDEISEEIKQSRGYQIIKETGMMLDYVDSILEDASGEHNILDIAW